MAKRRAVALPGFVEVALDGVLDRALRLQRPAVTLYLDRIRLRHRGATPSEVIRLLERRYLAAVTVLGAASGSAAAVPGAGTATSLASAAVEISAFTEATALFALAMAEMHGVRIDDAEARRAIVLAILLGDTGVEAAEIAAVGASARWGQVMARRAPEETIHRINHALSRHFLARFGSRQGALAVGRALPLGVGAGIGAAGNAALGRSAVLAARRMFGPPPANLPPRIVDA